MFILLLLKEMIDWKYISCKCRQIDMYLNPDIDNYMILSVPISFNWVSVF